METAESTDGAFLKTVKSETPVTSVPCAKDTFKPPGDSCVPNGVTLQTGVEPCVPEDVKRVPYNTRGTSRRYGYSSRVSSTDDKRTSDTSDEGASDTVHQVKKERVDDVIDDNSCPVDSAVSPPKTQNRPWEKPYTLPPCKICGAKGTGFHYGVNTCEACKGFFRRSLGRQNELECQKSVRCHLKPGKRSMCPYCRFQKCLQVGMSVDGIKTGRYTAAKRRQDTVEVKQLQAKRVLEDIQKHTESRQVELQQMVDVLVEADSRNLNQWQKCDCELLKLNTRFMGEEKEENPTADSQLNDQEKVGALNKVLALLEDIVKSGVKFMKYVPGFKQLDMDDQILLFKASLTDMRFLHGHSYYNTPEGHQSMMFNLCNVFGEEMGKKAERVIMRLRGLQLALEETTVLVCLVAFTTDRCELKQPEQIDRIHEQLLEALQYLLQKNHPGDSLIFPRIVGCFTELRTLHEVSRNCVNNMLEQNMDKGVVQVPPIFWEINSRT